MLLVVTEVTIDTESEATKALALLHLSFIPGDHDHVHCPEAGLNTRFEGWQDCKTTVESQQLTNLWQSKSYPLGPLLLTQ